MADEINVKVKVDSKEAEKSLGRLTKDIDNTGKSTESLSRQFVSVAKTSAVAFTAIGAGIGLVVSQAAKFETIQTQFEVLTGSTRQAEAAMKSLADFSARTPFQFEDVASAGQKLLSFGFGVDELNDRLQEIGDVSAASGADLSELTLIYGQVAAAGKLTGERLLQLQERAIPIGPALAKTLGVAESSVRDLVSAGKVTQDVFEKAFATLNQEGGFAFGGLEKRSQTLAGTISTLKDNLILLGNDIGQALLPQIKSLASGLIEITRFWKDFIQGTKTSASELPAIEQELKKVEERFDTLSKKQAELKQRGSISQALFGKAELAQTEQLLLGTINRMTELREEIDAIRKQQEADTTGETARALSERAKAETETRNAAIQEGLLAESDLRIAALNERLILENELQTLSDEERLAALQENLAIETSLKEEQATRELILKKDFNKARKKAETEQTKSTIAELKAQEDAAKKKAQVEMELERQKLESQKSTLATISSLQQSTNRSLVVIGKAAAISLATINTAEGITKALASFPPPINFAFAAAVGAAGAVQVARISGITPGFAEGGMVTGGIPGVDSVPIMAQQGELVVPRENFEDVIRRFGGDTEGNTNGQEIQVTIGFTDNAFDIIEEKILERRAIGTGLL